MFIDAVGLVFYAFGVSHYLKFNSSAKLVALFVGLGPIIFNGIYRGIMASIFHTPFWSIFTLSDVITFMVQFILAYVIFYLAQRNENSVSSTWLVLIAGGFVSYCLVPAGIPWLIGIF